VFGSIHPDPTTNTLALTALQTGINLTLSQTLAERPANPNHLCPALFTSLESLDRHATPTRNVAFISF
jgi:hypothetical protein